MSIWFKQSKCALNIDSNGHQNKKQNYTKNVLKQKRTRHKKNMFLHLYIRTIHKAPNFNESAWTGHDTGQKQ